MHVRPYHLVATVLAGLVIALDCATAAPSASTLLVIPARKRVVELAFSVAQTESVGLVAYSTSGPGPEPFLNVWNGREWVAVSVDDYLGGTFLGAPARNVILVGGPSILPAQLAGDPVWASKVHRVPSLETAELVNQLGTILKFTPIQWERVAAANGLKLTDSNAERRRYGKYGPPGTPPKKSGASQGVALPPTPQPPEPKGGKVEIVSPVVKPPASVPEKRIEPKPAEIPVPPAPPAPEVKAPPAPPAPAVPKVEIKVVAPAPAPEAPKTEVKAPTPPEAPKVEAPKAEPAKVEVIKIEAPKVVDPKAEAPATTNAPPPIPANK
jgi:hypothetical protein